MAVMDGVRIGPLDVDKGENLGMVGGGHAARRLIRHHATMNPPALTAALSRVRQDARSEAVDRDEAEAVIREWYEENGEALPEDARITGYAVRGDDEQRELQVVTFTFRTASGRTAKGFVPYGDLPKSMDAGTEAVRIKKAIDAGRPVDPVARGASGPDPEVVALREAVEALTRRLAEVEDRDPQSIDDVLAHEDAASGMDADADVAPEGAAEPPAAPLAALGTLVEPWDGFEGTQAQVVRQRLRDSGDADVAARVLAWETRPDGGQNRSTVVAAANEILDRKAPSDGS